MVFAATTDLKEELTGKKYTAPPTFYTLSLL